MPAISKFIDSSSGMKVRGVGAAERKTKGVFESDLAQAGEAKNVREHSAGEDTDAVASDAMHGRSQGLAPTRRDVLLVQSG
jgi:hypothetical protein